MQQIIINYLKNNANEISLSLAKELTQGFPSLTLLLHQQAQHLSEDFSNSNWDVFYHLQETKEIAPGKKIFFLGEQVPTYQDLHLTPAESNMGSLLMGLAHDPRLRVLLIADEVEGLPLVDFRQAGGCFLSTESSLATLADMYAHPKYLPKVVAGWLKEKHDLAPSGTSHALLEDILQTMPNVAFSYAINLAKQDFTYHYVSAAAEHLWGFSSESYLKDRHLWFNHLHPDDREHIIQPAIQRLLTEEAVSLGYRYMHPSKGERFFDTCLFPKRIDQNTIRVTGFAYDITEQKMAEASSKIEAQLLGILLKQSNDSIYFKNKKSEFIKVSDSTVQKFGALSEEEVIGKTDADFFFEQHAAKALRDEQNILQTGESLIKITEHEVTRDGRLMWSQSSKFPMLDEKGNIVGTCGISRNITDQVKVEMSLRESERKFRAVFQASPDAGTITRLEDGLYIDVNDGFCKISGYTREEVIGKTSIEVSIVANPADRQKLVEVLKRDGVVQGFELGFRLKNGTQVVGQMSAYVISIRGEDHLIAITRDISDRIQQEKDLKEALAEKSNFLSVMSHEIRTPLNAIIGMAHLLQHGQLYKEQVEIVDTLHFSSQNLLALINEILDYSKIQAGKLEIEQAAFDLRMLLKKTKKLFSYQASDKNLTFSQFLEEEVPQKVIGDSLRLSQVLNNLLSNAIKFTHEGSVELTVEVQKETDREVFLRFEVTDTGIGIAAEKHQLIFEPFRQADSKTTRAFGGTGLGLAIASRLVELQQGQLEFTSEPGQGSCFWFTIPFGKSTQTDLNTASNNGNYEEKMHLLQKLSVIYAEDVVPNQFLMRGYFQQWNLPLALAQSGQECVDLVRNGDFNLVLMDIRMPGMDGLEATMEIRKTHPQLPIVAVTASTPGELEVMKYKEKGMNAQLTKPIVPEKLLDLLLSFARRLE